MPQEKTVATEFSDEPLSEEEQNLVYEKMGYRKVLEFFFAAPDEATIGEMRKELRGIIYE